MNAIETRDFIFKRLKCLRCNYEWYPKIVNNKLKEPETCAKCRSKYWNKKKVRFY